MLIFQVLPQMSDAKIGHLTPLALSGRQMTFIAVWVSRTP
jgi:hypothetical protein